MSLSFEMHGFDKLEKRLDKLAKDADALNGTKLSFGEIFNDSFMHKHSKFSSLSELLESGGYSTDADEFAKIPDDEFDEFVRSNTDFSSWEDMQKEAASECALKKLGF